VLTVCLDFSLLFLSYCTAFFHSSNSLDANGMPITEQQAIEWAGSATADQLTTIQSFRPDGRLTADLCRQMMLVSTGVAHCFLARGPQPPIFNLPPGSGQEEAWCQAFLRRDERKRQTLDGTQASKTTLANKKAADDAPFFMSFGHQSDIRAWENHFPFLQVSCALSPVPLCG